MDEHDELTAIDDDRPDSGGPLGTAMAALDALRLDAVVRGIDAGVLIEDAHRRILRVNARFCAMFGIDAPPEALVGMDCQGAAEGAAPLFVDPAAFVEGTAASVRARRAVTAERLRLVDGRVLERDYVPIDDADGPAGGMWQYRDVTERQRVHALVERSNRLLAALTHAQRDFLLDETPPPVILEALLGEILALTGSASGVIGEVHARADGGHVVSAYAGAGAAWDPEALLARVVQTGAQVREDADSSALLGLPLTQGVELVGVVGLVGRDAGYDDAVVAYLEPFLATCATLLASLRKLDAQRDAERRLLESERRKTAIVDTALDCIVTIDADGGILDFNPAAEQTFGYRRDEVVGLEMAEVIVPPSLREAHRRGMRRRGATPDAPSAVFGQRLELTAMRRDGTEFPVELSIRRMPGDGAPTYTGVIRDITARKQQQAALEAARDAAEQANRAKSEFLAVMSHEIRTPMNAILGMTELAMEQAGDRDARELLGTVQGNAESLLHLIDDILDFSRLEAGAIRIVPEPCSLVDVVEGGVDSLEQRAADKGLELLCHVSAALPGVVLGDPHRLRQILINLVGNALKFTATGRVSVRAEPIARDDTRHWVRFEVRDSGVGIPAGALSQVFERFYQVDGSTQRSHGGTGLGLSICRTLVRMMGGDIAVKSELGVGSCFTVELPFEATGVRLARRRIMDRSYPGQRAVVVGEDGEVTAAVGEILRGAGFEVAVFERGADAHTAVLAEPPGVVVVDDGVGADAMRALAAVRQTQGRTGPLLLTRDSTVNGAEWPSVQVVPKPATRRRLLGAVASAVRVGLATAPQRLPREGSVTQGDPPRLLLVEDHADNRRYVTRVLELAGYRVAIAEDGHAGLEHALAFCYDLVLLDLEMPRLDGFGFARALRDREAEDGRERTTLVAVTAHAVDGVRERALASGIDDYLTKPISRQGLIDRVRRWVDPRPVLLIVDDSAASRTLASRYLASAKWHVRAVAGGAAALEELQRRRVSAVLLDMHMPGMDGYTVARAIRAMPGFDTLPIIAVTSHAGPDEARKCLAAGCSDYLAKPLRRNALVEAVADALQRREGVTADGSVPDLAPDLSAAGVVRVDPDIADLVDGYLDSVRASLARLPELFADRDIAAIRTIGHDLKGSGAGYGFAFISEVGGKLEAAAVADDLERAEALRSLLATHVSTVVWTSAVRP